MVDPGKGRFITIEGGEGTGKSTLLQGLERALRENGIPLLVTREPGGTPLAEQVRNLVLHPPEGQSWAPLAQALLMNAARVDHLEKQIAPALEAGTWVLCDRFADSTRAYQSADGGVDLAVLKQIETWVLQAAKPDLTLILDVPPEVATERRRLRAGASDAFEDRASGFHHSVRQVFLDIAREEAGRCRLIDANQAPEVVCADAMAAISAAFSDEVLGA